MGNEYSSTGPSSSDVETQELLRKRRETIRELVELYRTNESVTDIEEKWRKLSTIPSVNEAEHSPPASTEGILVGPRSSHADHHLKTEESTTEQESDQESALVMDSSGSVFGRPPVGRTSGTTSSRFQDSETAEDPSWMKDIIVTDSKGSETSSKESEEEVKVVTPESKVASSEDPYTSTASYLPSEQPLSSPGVDPDNTDPNIGNKPPDNSDSFSLEYLSKTCFQPQLTSTPIKGKTNLEEISSGGEVSMDEITRSDLVTVVHASHPEEEKGLNSSELPQEKTSILKTPLLSTECPGDKTDISDIEQPRKSSVHFDDAVQLSYFSMDDTVEDFGSSQSTLGQSSVSSNPLPRGYDSEVLLNQSEDVIRRVLLHGPVSSIEVCDIIQSSPAVQPDMFECFTQNAETLSKLSLLISDSSMGSSHQGDSASGISVSSEMDLDMEEYFENIVREIVFDMIHKHFDTQPAGDATVNNPEEELGSSRQIPATVDRQTGSCPTFPTLKEDQSVSEGDIFISKCLRQVQSSSLPKTKGKDVPSSDVSQSGSFDKSPGEQELSPPVQSEILDQEVDKQEIDQATRQKMLKRGSLKGQISPTLLLREKQKKNMNEYLSQASDSSAARGSSLDHTRPQEETESQETLRYPTPSELHQKVSEKQAVKDSVTQESHHAFPTPSVLLQKIMDREKTYAKQLETQQSLESYATPSDLYQKVFDRDTNGYPGEKSESKLPQFMPTTPTPQKQMSEGQKTAALAGRRHSLPAYSTTSDLLQKVEERTKAQGSDANKTYRRDGDSVIPTDPDQVQSEPVTKKKTRIAAAPRDSLFLYKNIAGKCSKCKNHQLPEVDKDDNTGHDTKPSSPGDIIQDLSGLFVDSNHNGVDIEKQLQDQLKRDEVAQVLAKLIMAATTYAQGINTGGITTDDHKIHTLDSEDLLHSDYESEMFSSSSLGDSGLGSTDYSSSSTQESEHDVSDGITQSAPACLVKGGPPKMNKENAMQTKSSPVSPTINFKIMDTPSGYEGDSEKSLTTLESALSSGKSVELPRGNVSQSHYRGQEWSYGSVSSEPSANWLEMIAPLLQESSAGLQGSVSSSTKPISGKVEDISGRRNPLVDHMDDTLSKEVLDKESRITKLCSTTTTGKSSPEQLTVSQLNKAGSYIHRDTPVPWLHNEAPPSGNPVETGADPPSLLSFSDLRESPRAPGQGNEPSHPIVEVPATIPPPLSFDDKQEVNQQKNNLHKLPSPSDFNTEHGMKYQEDKLTSRGIQCSNSSSLQMLPQSQVVSQGVQCFLTPLTVPSRDDMAAVQHQEMPYVGNLSPSLGIQVVPESYSTSVSEPLNSYQRTPTLNKPSQEYHPGTKFASTSGGQFSYQSPSGLQHHSTGASLPTSRVTSPTPDQILGSSSRRSSGALTSSLRSQLVDKEVLESQIRRLQGENATLCTENKLLKDKYNRSQARNQQLEHDLIVAQENADLGILKRGARDRNQRNLQLTEEHLATLTREMERLKAENESLESQLEAARHSSDMVRMSTDRPKIIAGFRIELNALQEEQAKLKKLLAQSESARQLEANKRKESAAQVVKLTEVKAMLQQELEQQGGGTSAHKQVKSLETRLHITEDRLHQERADRAGKLSQVEDKLLNENAKLQVCEKELRRQLQRERDKLRNSEAKLVECREELERTRILLGERPLEEHHYEGLYEGLNTKKHADEVRHIMDEIKREDNLGEGQEEKIIWLLWQRKERLTQQLAELELCLSSLKVDGGQISAGLKKLREERQLHEERILRYKESLDDLSKGKEEMDKLLRGQIKDLVSEKHNLSARLKTTDDLNAAISAENESLKASLRTAAGLPPTKTGGYSTWEAQVESLKTELFTARGEADQHSRQHHLLESEITTLRAQLRAKEQSLEEALDELEKVGGTRLSDTDLADRKQHKIDKLNAEIKGLQAEVKLWQEKYHNASLEVTVVEDRVDGLAKQISYSQQGAAPSLSRETESRKLDLEEQLQEKDVQVMQMSVNYNTAENELQRVHQRLTVQHNHADELKAQIDQLRSQLRQQSRTLEQTTSTESHKRIEVEALKENLATSNRELNNKNNEVKKLQLAVEQEKWRVERLTEDLKQRDHQLGENIVQLVEEGRLNTALDMTASTNREALASAETKIRSLQFEKDAAVNDIQHVQQAVESLVQDNTQLLARVREAKQEVAKEHAHLCQLMAEKGELEQTCHILTAERDSLQQEKLRMTKDLANHETDLQQVLQNLHVESLQQQDDLVTQYKHLGSEGKQMALEAATMKRLVEAREQEVILLRDLIEQQKGEAETLCHKMAVVMEENTNNQREIEHLTTNLATKIKEAATSTETSQILASERSALSFEKYRLEHDRGKERGEAQRRLNEIGDLHKRLERTEEKHHHAEKSLHERETSLVAVETELRHVKKNMVTMETERSQLCDQMNKLNQEIRNLFGINSTLETRLSMEKSVVSEEKSNRNQMRDDLSAATRQIEIIHREFEIQRSNLDSERRTVQLLKEQCQREEDRAFQLEDHARTMELEIQTLKSHLAENRNTIDQYKKDKQTLYQDVQELSRKLADRDDLVSQLQGQCAHTVETIQKDFTTEKTYLDRERDRLELDLNKSKDKLSEANEKLRQKELQLEAYFRTNRELDIETKARQEAEHQLALVETTLLDVKHQLSSLQADHARLSDTYTQCKLDFEQTQGSTGTMRDQMKVQREQYTREVQELRHTLTEEKHRHEVERVELQDRLNQAHAAVKGLEASLGAVKETKESLAGTNKSFEKTVDELKSKISEEITSRKLAEQRVESLKVQLEEVLHKRANVDEHTAELHAKIVRLETELAAERNQHRKLQHDLASARSSGDSHQARTVTMETQITDLQTEVTNLRSQLETHKQSLSGKNKRLALEMKQQLETFEQERSKLVSQVQQLSSDLESARNTIANKNRDNLSLTQEKLSMEENLRDAQAKLRLAQDALKMEDELRIKMESRLREMEVEISKQRARSGVDGDSDTSRLEVARNEVNKMMAEVTRRMQEKLETGRDLDGKRDSNKLVEEVKKRLASVESSLNHEQAMHLVTKTQLASVEEDNSRLRQQLSSARRRLANTGAEERTKSRIEEINEIIARSQTRAQAMLASGAYTEEALRCMSPPPLAARCMSPTPLGTTSLSPIPFMLSTPMSPLNMSMEDSPTRKT